ncbi:MAG: NAD-dependent epimerase/dehydratase family protein [Deltaproteobacteria bacterium]|nr:NAD-dependent epimerase/dehydratase family protein [Deltaproteobacteria bacterium]
MKLFVTGATGFLGRAVVDACLAEGHQVRAMVRDPHHRLPEAVDAVHVGFEEGGRLREALAGCEAVLHLAGKVSRDPADAGAMHWIHVEATQMLLDAIKDVGKMRFILASTSGTIAVSENKRRRPARESDRPPFEVIGKWPYYTSKLLQEQEVMRRNHHGEIEAVILNPSLLLGPGDERLSSTTDVLNILNRRVSAVTDGTVAMVDVRDCAPAFVRALTDGRPGEKYLLNGANMSVRVFVERVCTAGDVPIPKLRLPGKWALAGAKLLDGLAHATDRTPAMDPTSVEISNHHWDCDAKKATAELGFVARDPQETINGTVRFLEKKGLFRRV